MHMFEDARDFVFAIMPIIMRININIEFVDTRQQLQSSIPYKARQRGTTGYREDDHLNLHSETLSLFLHDRHYDLLYRKDHPSDLVWLFDRDKDLNNLIIDIDILNKKQEAETEAKLAEELERLQRQ